jgi:RNA polymerase sigma-70 factor, ECF subfamily
MEFNIVKRDDALTVLAVRMKKGDRRAAAKLYDELLPKAYGFFFVRTGHRETAEDLSQEIFLKLVEKVETFDEGRGRFAVWFWRMARNMLVDHYRAKKEKPFSAFDETAVEAMSIEEMPDVDDKLRYEEVKEFMKSLSEEERELFELRYVVELPYREIAELLGKSEGALRVATLRIKEKVRKEFKDEI